MGENKGMEILMISSHNNTIRGRYGFEFIYENKNKMYYQIGSSKFVYEKQ